MRLVFEAFATQDSPLPSVLAEPWQRGFVEPIVGDPAALAQKLVRCQYVLQQLCEPRRVLDYGSGMGFLACYMSAEGVDVTGVEIASQWRDAERVLAQAFETDRATFVETDRDLERGSFDAVTMCNTVSHIAHLSQVFCRVHELLRPGGIVFIEDNNNRRSLIVKRRQPKVWESADRGYAKVRAKLDPGREHETYGLGREEIEHWRDRDLPPISRLREFAPRSPRNGSYDENWFDPHELEVMLFNTGFAPVSHRAKYVFDYKTNKPVSAVFRRLPRLSLFVAPAFEVTAVKV